MKENVKKKLWCRKKKLKNKRLMKNEISNYHTLTIFPQSGK